MCWFCPGTLIRWNSSSSCSAGITHLSLNSAMDRGKLTVRDRVTRPSSSNLAGTVVFGQSRALIIMLAAAAGKNMAGNGKKKRVAAV